ncbi:glycosyltransferase, partial [Akkermansiaceae bacterium]|nr:glycosyltransferase [Akkermansiaceae bacterium]
YQGGLNWKRGLKQVIESMPLWKSGAALCLVGNIDLQPSFPHEAMDLAKSLGVADRLLIKNTVPYLELPSITRACDVGLGVMASAAQNTNINIQHLAGASNKLVEYMAFGLPVVVPDTPEYREYVEAAGVGIVADVESVQSIADSIDVCLECGEQRKAMSHSARQAFLDDLNFDSEFDKILRLVDSREAVI